MLLKGGIFKPLYFFSEKTQALTTRACVPFAISIPYGVGKHNAGKQMHRPEEINENLILPLCVKWSAEMTDVRPYATYAVVDSPERKKDRCAPSQYSGF